MLDSNQVNFPDVQNDIFQSSATFPNTGTEIAPSNLDIENFDFDNFLDDTSAYHQPYDVGGSKPIAIDPTITSNSVSRQATNITPPSTSHGDSNSGYSLTRIKTGTTNDSHSDKDPYSASSSFVPDGGFRLRNQSLKAASPRMYDAAHGLSNPYPSPTSFRTSPSQIQISGAPAKKNSESGITSMATRSVSTTELEWPPTPRSRSSINGEVVDIAKVGKETRGSRTTITLEDAEPGTIMDVMKVLVSSKAKVRFETG